jgi:hypothetical protein
MNYPKEHFNQVLNKWISDLDQLSLAQLVINPSIDSWSMGQLYNHMLSETKHYFEQIRICLSTNDNMNEEASAEGKIMLYNDSFPDERIQGAPSHAPIPQPENTEQLRDGLIQLQNEMNSLTFEISQTNYQGKSRHPGLNYFSAAEWLQFAEMHFRHHEKQKLRIASFLNSGKIVH